MPFLPPNQQRQRTEGTSTGGTTSYTPILDEFIVQRCREWTESAMLHCLVYTTSSGLALCHSVAECPVWSRSSHTNLIDCQLNSTMRFVPGCLHPTQTQRLPVPSNIASPNLRRQSAVDKILCKIVNHQDWPVRADVFSHASQRLSSRHPIWLDLSPVDMNSQWKEDWQSA